MKSARNHAILSRVSRHVARSIFANCEPLEVRRLLDGDPVIVLTEPVADSLASALEDYLWNNLQEEPFDPPITGTPDTMDGGDSNTLPGDRHGWNFATDSANFTPDTTLNAHGTAVSSYVLEVLANAPDGLGENVKIMYVIPDGDRLNGESDALDYILAHENAGINIVAVGAPTSLADRAGAEALGAAGIMLIGGLDNTNISYDGKVGDDSSAFYSATPRFGVQDEPLDNIFPVTTDPRGGCTAYGMNSFYAGVAKYDGTAGPSFQGDRNGDATH